MFEFFSGGYTELGGSITEHQGGCVIGAATEQGMTAAADKNNSDFIRVEIEGFGKTEMEIGDTEPRAEEAESPAALIRGIMNCFIESGNIFGGFDAVIKSDIPSGSGLSSSAGFEVLVGKIISGLFFENTVPAVRLAQFGQAAENDYFKRPCGLMDKLVCAVGGTVFADFSDPEMPFIKKLDFDFSKSGYSAAIIDCGKDRIDLRDDYYEAIRDMGFVAWNMGHTFLSEADEAEFIAQFPILRQKCGEKAVMHALHYFEEKRRASEEAEALENGNFGEFLKIYRESAESFENIFKDKKKEELFKAVSAAGDILGSSGAAGICGDFSGTVQAILPEEVEAEFADEMEKLGFGVMFVI